MRPGALVASHSSKDPAPPTPHGHRPAMKTAHIKFKCYNKIIVVTYYTVVQFSLKLSFRKMIKYYTKPHNQTLISGPLSRNSYDALSSLPKGRCL